MDKHLKETKMVYTLLEVNSMKIMGHICKED